MKKTPWRTYFFWIVLAEAVGATSGWATREGVQVYGATVVKPLLSPPPIVFPIVWTLLYALMGIGAARICLAPPSKDRTMGSWLFLIQLAFNFSWSFIFFNAQAFGAAFLWLLVLLGLVLWMVLSFRRVDRLAAALQIPYVAWLVFAGYLTLSVWSLNAP